MSRGANKSNQVKIRPNRTELQHNFTKFEFERELDELKMSSSSSNLNQIRVELEVKN